MQKRILIRCLCLLLCVCTLLPITAACSKVEEVDENETVSTDNSEGRVYKCPKDVNLEGRTYTILNCYKDQWEQLCLVTSHEYNGIAMGHNDMGFIQ